MNLPKKQEEAKAVAIILIVVVALIVAGYAVYRIFGGIDSALESLGLKQSEADKKLEKDLSAVKNQDYFSPTYWRKPPQKYLNDKGKYFVDAKYKSAVEALAKKIYNAVGFLYDTPENTAAAFEEIKNKAQVSQLAEFFTKKYGVSLYQYLVDKMDTDKQRAVLSDIVARLNNLPDGFRKV